MLGGRRGAYTPAVRRRLAWLLFALAILAALGVRTLRTPPDLPPPTAASSRRARPVVTRLVDALTGGGAVVCVTDATGAPLSRSRVEYAERDGDCWRIGFAPECVRVDAPGFLATELCTPSLFDPWPPARHEVRLTPGRDVALACDDGDGAAPCERRALEAACVTPTTADFGLCRDDRCVCPDDPEAHVVVTMGRWMGEVAPVEGARAVVRRTGTASLVVSGPLACDGQAFLTRAEEALDVPTALLPRCGEDGRAILEGLVAGDYTLTVGTADRFTFSLAEGQHLELVPARPPLHPVDVAWPGDPPPAWLSAAQSGAWRGTWLEPGTVQAPDHGVLWVCTDEGCCRFEDPGDSVRCVPSPGVGLPM